MKIIREVTKDQFGNNQITYQRDNEIFEDYTLSIDNFHKELIIGCNFIEKDINNNIVNRKMRLSKKEIELLINDFNNFLSKGKI